MIVKSFLGIFLVIICVSITKQAPQARQQNNESRPRFGNYVEHFLQYLDRQGVSDQEKINYLGEILSALSYFKFNDPNFLEYCVGQKIIQDGYRDAQRQKNHNNGDDEENISDRTTSNRFRDPFHENQGKINKYDNQPTEDKNDPKTHNRRTQDQYYKPTHQYQTHGIDGYHSSHIENYDEDQKGSSYENEDDRDDLHGDENDYSYSDDNSSEDDDDESSDNDHFDDNNDYQENSEDHDNDTHGYSEGNDKEKMEDQSIDGHNFEDQVQHTRNEDNTHVTSDPNQEKKGGRDRNQSRPQEGIMGPSSQTTNRDRYNHHLNDFSFPQGSLNNDYNKYSDGSRNRDTYGRNSQNYDPYQRQYQENKPGFTKNDYRERSPNSSNSRDSYDPYNGHVGQRQFDEIEYSGDYENTNSPAQDTSKQVDDYLNRIHLHNLPPDLAKYAESYLNYAKNAVRTYGSYAKNINDIRPCLESLVQYFNLLNEDLANAYKRCQDDCFYSRLDSYSTSVTQYTATTNDCIAKGMY